MINIFITRIADLPFQNIFYLFHLVMLLVNIHCVKFCYLTFCSLISDNLIRFIKSVILITICYTLIDVCACKTRNQRLLSHLVLFSNVTRIRCFLTFLLRRVLLLRIIMISPLLIKTSGPCYKYTLNVKQNLEAVT